MSIVTFWLAASPIFFAFAATKLVSNVKALMGNSDCKCALPCTGPDLRWSVQTIKGAQPKYVDCLCKCPCGKSNRVTIGKPKTDDYDHWEGTGGTDSRSTMAAATSYEEANRVVLAVPPPEIPLQQAMPEWPHLPAAPPMMAPSWPRPVSDDESLEAWHARVQAMEVTQAARNQDDPPRNSIASRKKYQSKEDLSAVFSLPTVWVTRTGDRYHSERCKMLINSYKASKQGTKLFKKLNPCANCAGWMERRTLNNNFLPIEPGCFTLPHNRIASEPDDDW